MIDKNTVDDISEDELMAFLDKWLKADEECAKSAFAIEKRVTTFEMTVIEYVRAGLLIIPYNIGDFGE